MQGLPEKYDPKKLLKAMKKEFACNGTVVASAESDSEDDDAEGGAGGKDGGDAKEAKPAASGTAKPNFGQILQFQGDQRMAVKEFLVKAGLYSEKEAKDKIVMCVLLFTLTCPCRSPRITSVKAVSRTCIGHWPAGAVACQLAGTLQNRGRT